MGFKTLGKENMVCKQSPRQWYKRFDSFIKGMKYRWNHYDLFVSDGLGEDKPLFQELFKKVEPSARHLFVELTREWMTLDLGRKEEFRLLLLDEILLSPMRQCNEVRWRPSARCSSDQSYDTSRRLNWSVSEWDQRMSRRRSWLEQPECRKSSTE